MKMVTRRRSFRECFEAVTKVPKDLRKFSKGAIANNPRNILGFLMVKPNEVTIANYSRSDRMVRFRKTMTWIFKIKEGTLKVFRTIKTDTVPRGTVDSAVEHLSETLREAGLPYVAWAECHSGNPRNKKGKRMIPREIAPLKIGLVDTTKPKDGYILPPEEELKD